jgi:hypothetical protein
VSHEAFSQGEFQDLLQDQGAAGSLAVQSDVAQPDAIAAMFD